MFLFEGQPYAPKGKNREPGLQENSVRNFTGRRTPVDSVFSFDLLAFIPVRHFARRGFFYKQPIAWKIWWVFENFGKAYGFILTRADRNRLKEQEVHEVLKGRSIQGREPDEQEVKGYLKALDEMALLANRHIVTETNIQLLHSLIMGGNTPDAYRTGQNSVTNPQTGTICYIPPQITDVGPLMTGLVEWINESTHTLPIPIVAAIAHYQFVTIYPYEEGNGRTARILTRLILNQNGYDLKGIYNLEEYYYKHLQDYYNALAIGPSRDYYTGRAEADITEWIEFFVSGMLDSFQKAQELSHNDLGSFFSDLNDSLQSIRNYFQEEGIPEGSNEGISTLDARQKRALALFEKNEFITAKEIEELFHFAGRTARQLLQKWVQQGFIVVADPSKKARKYKLNK